MIASEVANPKLEPASLLEWLGATSLRHFTFDWPTRLGLDVHDCRYEALHSGQLVLKGRGTSRSPKQAQMKAFGELLERAFVIKSGIADSNGWACHTDVHKAAANARFELIERDLYLCHFLSSTPFQPIALSNPDWPGWVAVAAAKLRTYYGVELLFGRMGHPDDGKPAACTVSAFGGKHFGVITSQACAASLHDALDKAVLECLRNVMNQLSDDPEHAPMSAEEFHAKDQPSALDHFKVGLGGDVSPYVRSLYPTSTASLPGRSSQVWDRTSLRMAELPGPMKLHAVQAVNPSMQGTFFGRAHESQVNVDRLRNFTGRSWFSLQDIVNLPHTHH